MAAEYEFLRLKNIELGYSLPKNLWRNTTVISGIRLFVRGTNLLTFSKFDLWDPEVENTTGAAYPIMKSLSAGLKLNSNNSAYENSILKFIVLSIITTFTFSSCSDYLDKQPDDQLDLESVFENKKNMERWLAYIYRGLPEYYTYDGPDAIADELIPSVGWEAQGFKAIQYQKGNWTADNPGVITYWNTYPKYIRSAYLFIKHAHPLEAVPAEEVDFMKAECRFFIAYYNSMMAIAYGAVPIIREASESTSADDLMLKQEPFYNVIDWADQEMLEASKQLPATQTEDKKYGRVTSVGCLAMRARMLLFAASDLVNGNPALANIKTLMELLSLILHMIRNDGKEQ